MVYVDESIWPYGRMVMCHLLADTLPELHAMADKIGVARRWFQNRRYPHYDICKSKRALAVGFGAIEIDRKRFSELAKRVPLTSSLGNEATASGVMSEGQSQSASVAQPQPPQQR